MRNASIESKLIDGLNCWPWKSFWKATQCTSSGFLFLFGSFLTLESRFPMPGACVITKAPYFIYWKECHVLFSSIQSNVLVVVKVPNTHFLSALAAFFSPLYHLFLKVLTLSPRPHELGCGR